MYRDRMVDRDAQIRSSDCVFHTIIYRNVSRNVEVLLLPVCVAVPQDNVCFRACYCYYWTASFVNLGSLRFWFCCDFLLGLCRCLGRKCILLNSNLWFWRGVYDVHDGRWRRYNREHWWLSLVMTNDLGNLYCHWHDSVSAGARQYWDVYRLQAMTMLLNISEINTVLY